MFLEEIIEIYDEPENDDGLKIEDNQTMKTNSNMKIVQKSGRPKKVVNPNMNNISK